MISLHIWNEFHFDDILAYSCAIIHNAKSVCVCVCYTFMVNFIYMQGEPNLKKQKKITHNPCNKHRWFSLMVTFFFSFQFNLLLLLSVIESSWDVIGWCNFFSSNVMCFVYNGRTFRIGIWSEDVVRTMATENIGKSIIISSVFERFLCVCVWIFQCVFIWWN